MLFPKSERRKESAVSWHIDVAPETPGDAPVTPRWRSLLRASMPACAEPAEYGPKRLTRHELLPEEGHQRGR